jgi:hypothetical protein
MRRLLISTFVSLVLVAPALAQDAPKDRAAGPNAAEDQDTLELGVQSIQRSIHARLALAGFTNIEMVPTSYLVRAKDRGGKPVMLMLSPDAIAELKEVMDQDSGTLGQGSGQDEGSRSETPPTSPTAPGEAQ